MKKKISIAVIAMIGAIVLGVGVYQSNASQGAPTLSTDEIKHIVLEQYPGEIEEIELETDFNQAVYEVEVISNGKEYELKLDGNTGEVLKLDEETINKKGNDKTAIVDNDDHDDNNDDHHYKKRHHENKKETAQKPTVEVKSKENKQQTKKTVISSN